MLNEKIHIPTGKKSSASQDALCATLESSFVFECLVIKEKT